MSTLDCRAFLYVIPAKAEVSVIDSSFHALGDVNYDGVIDGKDLDLLKEAYGKTAEEAPDCDLNGDGKVDIKDIGTCAINQGNRSPSYYTPFTTEVTEGKLVAIGRRGRQTLKATAFMASTKKILFFVYEKVDLACGLGCSEYYASRL